MIFPGCLGYKAGYSILFKIVNKRACLETEIAGDTTSNETILNMSGVVIKVSKQKQESGSEQ